MSEPSAAERLRALAQGNAHRSDSARLRDILNDVEAALDAGVSRSAILAELHAAGFTFKKRSFESALYNARREKKSNSSTPKQQRTEPSNPTDKKPETEIPQTRPRITNPGDLHKSITNQVIDLENL